MLLICLLLLPAAAFADSGDLDEIERYDLVVTPNTADGSLDIVATLDWKVLDQGPVEWVQIGIPNGSVTNLTAKTTTIDHMNFDSSYVYIYFDRGYQDGETIHFSYSWTQSYMYQLNGSAVSFNYTPGWFDEACVDEMSVTWNTVAGASGTFDASVAGGTSVWLDNTAADGTYSVTASDLEHGTRVSLNASYAAWPAALDSTKSEDNLPSEYEGGDYGDYGGYDDYYSSGLESIIGSVITIVIVIVVLSIVFSANARRSWAGGFGTRYVFFNGLYYPMGRDGRPRPGSVGTPHKPTPPPPPRGGGFGGGRGGGFGGGGFGGGGHCACASSCACACACAGGGRAGCSAKNLYGAIHLTDGALPAGKKKQESE